MKRWIWVDGGRSAGWMGGERLPGRERSLEITFINTATTEVAISNQLAALRIVSRSTTRYTLNGARPSASWITGCTTYMGGEFASTTMMTMTPTVVSRITDRVRGGEQQPRIVPFRFGCCGPCLYNPPAPLLSPNFGSCWHLRAPIPCLHGKGWSLRNEEAQPC